MLPKGLGARIELSGVPLSPVFRWLGEAGGIAQDEMLRTFNCGIGMIAIVARKDAGAVTNAFSKAGERVVTIGEVVRAGGAERVLYSGQLDLGG